MALRKVEPPDLELLTVVGDGRPAGRVEWLRRAWGRKDTSSCWEIAVGIFQAARGRGIGTAAQRQLTEYLFEHHPVVRVQATTDAENVPERRALERIGFRQEGVVRSAQ